MYQTSKKPLLTFCALLFMATPAAAQVTEVFYPSDDALASALVAIDPYPNLNFPERGRFEGEPAFYDGYVDEFNGGYDIAEPGTEANLQEIYVYGGMPGATKIVPFFGILTTGPNGVQPDTDWLLPNDPWGMQWDMAFIRVNRPVWVERYIITNNVPNLLDEQVIVPGYPQPVILVAGNDPVCLRMVPLVPASGEFVETQYLIYTSENSPEGYLELTGDNESCFGMQYIPLWYLYQVTAPPVGHGEFWFRNDTRSFVDNYNPGVGSLVGEEMSGPDAVIEIYLKSQPLSVHLDAPGWGGKCYLLSDCGEVEASCVAASDDQGDLNFTPTVPGYYYLVIDGPENGGGEFAIWGNFLHPMGFVIEEVMPENDTCNGATSVPRGYFEFSGNIGTGHNDYDPGVNGCTEWGDTGGDVVWLVEMASGDSLHVTMTTTGQWDDSLYLITDCTDPIGSCVAGNDIYPDGSSIEFKCEQPGMYYLITDSYGLGCNQFHLKGFFGHPPSSVSDDSGIPSAYRLFDAVPNPFNPMTKIGFDVPAHCIARLSIYDISGRLTRSLFSGQTSGGGHIELIWDGRDDTGRQVAAGVYFYRLEAGSFTETKRMVLMK